MAIPRIVTLESLQGPRETRSTCPYCGVGCGVIIRSEGPTIVDVRGDPEHPANFGRLCRSSAVSGYKATLGADAPPACYDDLAEADLVFITGSNLAWAHPILCRRLEDAKAARPSQKWIVVDPRKTETAAMADLHLQI